MNPILRKIARYMWRFRAKIFLDFPLPCFLAYGSLCLAYGDGMGATFFFKRPYEENEWRFISKFLKPGMTFFDIGANQGFYTLLAAKMVGPGGKVFAFEPVPSQIKKLKRNIKINCFHNIITEQLALGSEKGSANMYACLNGAESLSSLRLPSEDGRVQKKVIQVPITTLDNYVYKSNISSIDFIKIDVEGGELDVLKGGINVLKNLRPIFMCEVQDIRTGQWGYSASEIFKFLKNYNYSWFRVIAGGSLQSFKSEEEHELKEVNFIAVPIEKINYITNLLDNNKFE